MKIYCLRSRFFSMFCVLILVNLGWATACRTLEGEAGAETQNPTTAALAAEQVTDATSPEVSRMALPEADAVLLCEDTAGAHLWHYDANEQKWDQRSAELLNNPRIIQQGIIPVGGAGGILVYGVEVDPETTEQFQMYLWQESGERQVVNEDQLYTVVPQLTRRLASASDLYAAQVDGSLLLYRLNVDQCASASCQFEPVTNLVFTSPQGEKELTWDIQVGTLTLSGGEEESNVIDMGWAPFWLDENRFGYLRTAAAQPNLGDTSPVLMLWKGEEAGASVLLEPEYVEELLIEQDVVGPSADIVLLNAIGTEAHPDTILVSAADVGAQRAFLLTVAPQTGQVQYISEISMMAASEFELTPGGHFLVAETAEDLLLYALATGETMRLPRGNLSSELDSFAFTLNGEWLLLPAGSTSYFVDLLGGDVQEINLSDQYCTIGAWLESES